MFVYARRFRVVAALGLVLALAQGRAWGQEPIWAKAAKLVGCIWQVPQLVTPKQPPAKEQHAPLFAWEKQDAAAVTFTVGRFYELAGDYGWAYVHYQALSRRYPLRREFAAAVERAEAKRPVPRSFHPSGYWHDDGGDSCCSWFADFDSAPFLMPERKDMLPDSECGHALEQLGVIANANQLLSIEPPPATPFMLAPGYFH